MDDFYVLGDFIGAMIAQERPFRILEISGEGNHFGYLIKACQEQCGILDGVIDRIAVSGLPANPAAVVYDRIFDRNNLDSPELLDDYDFILILDLSGTMKPDNTRALLDALQYKIKRQALFITSLDSQAGYRVYHPVVFMGLDFSYSLITGVSKVLQAYSVFPKTEYDAMSMDHIPAQDAVERMEIAFVLPHHALTGGMKALLQQIRYLTRKGHAVSVYYRSDQAKYAIPPWSDLCGDDCSKQVVLASTDRFLNHIKDTDIIFLGGIDQALEFISSKIPVVVWEQGSEAMFGDNRKALHSSSQQRLTLHGLYRLSIHLLAVSDVIATALKGIYNRDAYVYPNGVDSDFYHPQKKHNDIPVILLTGHPALAFKGFRFAFDALHRAYAKGLRFQVKWAAQVKVIHGETSFPLEVTISPRQHELADMYRSADIFLSTSLYESYSLPPLEAMASGTAVVATDCGGIRTYGKDGENCIICRQGDVAAVTNALEMLINNQDERQRLAQAGRETALKNSAVTVVEMLEHRLFSIVHHNRQDDCILKYPNIL